MSDQTSKSRIASRVAGVMLAIVTAVGIATEPASATTLYFRGASIDPAAVCNADLHYMSLRTTVVKDPAYATQMVQFQFRITDLRTGYPMYLPVITRQLTSSYTWINADGIPKPAGGQYKVQYAVRFGVLGGYNAWSNWTLASHQTTWSRYGWFNTRTAACYT